MQEKSLVPQIADQGIRKLCKDIELEATLNLTLNKIVGLKLRLLTKLQF